MKTVGTATCELLRQVFKSELTNQQKQLRFGTLAVHKCSRSRSFERFEVSVVPEVVYTKVLLRTESGSIWK